MCQNEKNLILMDMIKKYPDYFLITNPRRNLYLKKISKEYNIDIRKIIREKKIALLALSLTEDRKDITIKDIEKAREKNRIINRDEKISLNKLYYLLRSKNRILANKVMNIIEKERNKDNAIIQMQD